MNFIKKWLQKRKEKKEFRRLSQQTLWMGAAGMINNPDICIKGLSTCACVCEKFMSITYVSLKDLEKHLAEK